MYIYKITAPDSQCYIGSTTIPIHRRWSVHKSGFIRYMLGKANFCAAYLLFLDYEPEECFIDILEVFPDGTPRKTILARERYHIQTYPCVNDYGRKTDEVKKAEKRAYREAHKDMWRKSSKDYYARNAEKQRQRARDYYAKKKAKRQPAPETAS